MEDHLEWVGVAVRDEVEVELYADHIQGEGEASRNREKVETNLGEEVIQEQLQSLCPISPNRCIYKAPEYLRQVNEEAYRPLVVSIGPYYSQDPRLEAMQHQKLRHLQRFLHRNRAHTLQDYMSYLRDKEQEARDYYEEEHISLDSQEFIRMLLLDATFIIEFFLLFRSGDFGNQKMVSLLAVYHDLFLEENQLPFFILQGLYDLVVAPFPTGKASRLPSFLDLTEERICNLFNPERTETEPASRHEKITKLSKVLHLVDFVRIYYSPSTPRQELPLCNWENQFPMSASELSAAGIRFVDKKTSSGSNSLLDIRFLKKKGILEIPKLRVGDMTESLLRSIMLLEQCFKGYYFDSYFIDYIFFLDSLINTPKDVQVLVEHGVLENMLGSNEGVVDLFNKITTHVTINDDEFYYSYVSRELNEYARTSWNRWRAMLKTDYFNHPWSTISVIYAVVLLLLTILQTMTGFSSNK